jgi:hypothetical protein
MSAALVVLAIAATFGVPAASAGDIVIKRDPSKAVYVPPAPPPPPASDTADGLDVGDAGIGAAGMLAIVAGAAGLVTLRGRRHSTRPVGA